MRATYTRRLGTETFLGFYDVHDDVLSGLVRKRKTLRELGEAFRFAEFDKLVHAAERSSGEKGEDPETSWRMAKTREQAPPHRALPYGRHRDPAQPRAPRALPQEARPGEVQDERHPPLHEVRRSPSSGAWRSARDFDPRLHGA